VTAKLNLKNKPYDQRSYLDPTSHRMSGTGDSFAGVFPAHHVIQWALARAPVSWVRWGEVPVQGIGWGTDVETTRRRDERGRSQPRDPNPKGSKDDETNTE